MWVNIKLHRTNSSKDQHSRGVDSTAHQSHWSCGDQVTIFPQDKKHGNRRIKSSTKDTGTDIRTSSGFQCVSHITSFN